jgi:hypothetical protein
LPGDVNAHRDQDVRLALAELRALAERTGAAAVVIRHLNKSPGGNPLYRGGGSIGIIGAARSGIVLARDPDDAEARVLAATKCNLAAVPPSLRLRLVVEPGGAHPRVAWEGASAYTADSLLSVPADPEERSKLGEATDFLRDRLGSGSAKARDVQRDAGQAGIGMETLRRARGRLRVIVEHVGQPGEREQHWRWRLPDEPAEDGQYDPSKMVDPLDLDHLPLSHGGKPLCEAESAEDGQVGRTDQLRLTTFGTEQSISVLPVAARADEWAGIPGEPMTPEEVLALVHQPPQVDGRDGSAVAVAVAVARPAASTAVDSGSEARP